MILIVSSVAVLSSGCSVFKPYIPNPKWDGSYSSALKAIEDTQSVVDDRLSSVQAINSYSGAGTLLGIGGAGIAAVFHGSTDLILGLTTLGAASLAVNGSYGNRPQTTIYRNGAAAFLCLQDSIAPVSTLHRSIAATVFEIEKHAGLVRQQLIVSSGSAEQKHTADEMLRSADTIDNKHRLRLAIEDGYAGSVISVLRSLINAVNAQLDTAIPDAAALARMGSSLASLSVERDPDVQNLHQPIGSAAQVKQAGWTGYKTVVAQAGLDNTLVDLMVPLQSSINQAVRLMSEDVKTPSIDCKVAGAPVIAPLSINTPGGSNEVAIAPKQTMSFPVSGGTPPYTQPRWIGSAPTFLTVIIESPDTLRISPNATAKDEDYKKSLTFTFDIYDALGKHLDAPVTIKTIETN
jgi:hypothetical protein